MQTAAIAFLTAVVITNGVLIVLAARAFLATMRGGVDSICDPE